MPLKFEPITLDNQDKYRERLSVCPQKASDYSFVNLWAWADEYGLLWAWEGPLVWIKQTKPAVSYWAPIGAWEILDWKQCLDFYFNRETLFSRVPDALVQIWKVVIENRIRIEPDRGHWDYLYSVSELTELKGNRFHKKKNLLNQFKKNFSYRYIPIKGETVNEVLVMQENWCAWRDCESSNALSAENRAIERTFKNWHQLKGLMGGAIMIKQTIVAYTAAESLSDNLLLIHFEKGDPEYIGVYQAINQMFLAHSGVPFTTVNREQDLDDEGLRNAKLSYHPVDFLRKFKVILS
ncbi:MAG TPA: phosphatidylglycerol lysyltransferase domain-containing protein [Desulfobacterales bacterium]|nr:phosphatidylglycerol lysyltransferase domain-containing protein [Desulfobacterales bacterium]